MQGSLSRTARTGQAEQDCQDKTTRTGLSAAKIKQPGRTKRREQQKRTARTGLLDQESQNDSARMGQPEQHNQDRASGKDRQNKTASTAPSVQYC
jgi:hypothetical protein